MSPPTRVAYRDNGDRLLLHRHGATVPVSPEQFWSGPPGDEPPEVEAIGGLATAEGPTFRVRAAEADFKT
jgi:hypothetical protein